MSWYCEHLVSDMETAEGLRRMRTPFSALVTAFFQIGCTHLGSQQGL